jgi:hypothetical protein
MEKLRERFLMVSFGLVVMLTSFIAYAELIEPKDPAEAVGLVGQIIEAIKVKNWGVLASLVIMLIVYGIRMIGLPYLQKKPEHLALVSQFLGCLATMAISLYAGGSVLNAIIGGLFIGAAASGFWSAVFKFILPKPKAEQQV